MQHVLPYACEVKSTSFPHARQRNRDNHRGSWRKGIPLEDLPLSPKSLLSPLTSKATRARKPARPMALCSVLRQKQALRACAKHLQEAPRTFLATAQFFSAAQWLPFVPAWRSP